jgi:hypothetical protein
MNKDEIQKLKGEVFYQARKIEKLKKENQQLIAQLKEMQKDYEFMKKAYNSLKGDD